MMSGTVPVSILGTNFAMAQHPFWKPDQFSTCILSIHQFSFGEGGGGPQTGNTRARGWDWTRYGFERLMPDL